jgi:SAM-dependent methyltransferase
MSEGGRNRGKGDEQPGRTSAVSRPRNKGDDAFYRAFEDEFRGSSELVRSRLQIYFAFIEPLKVLAERPTAIDLGCGRGEWLELLTEHGYQARGVDIDDGMLAACREKNLDVKNEDAIKFLPTVSDDSQMIVSAFHVVEHLPFRDLKNLIQHTFRVLKPGGLLLLETPNPENIKVSSLNFYLDPTHRHPLPPSLLSFLPKFYGFARVKIVRLQERPDLLESESVSLDEVLAGASPDYAVIAQKPCDDAIAKLFDSAFQKEFGIGDRTLVDRFDRQLAVYYNRVAALEARYDNLNRLTNELEERDRRLAAADMDLRRLMEHAGERDRRLAAADMELRCLIGEAQERDRRLAAADMELRRLSGEVEERDRRLASADAELRRLIGEAQERDRQLASADTELRRLIGEAQERDRQLASADTELRRLIDEAQERDRQLASADTQLRRLTGEAQERDRQLASADTELRRLIDEGQERESRLTEMRNHFAAQQDLAVERSAELDGIKRSFSWRVTAPLRAFAAVWRSFVRRSGT